MSNHSHFFSGCLVFKYLNNGSSINFCCKYINSPNTSANPISIASYLYSGLKSFILNSGILEAGTIHISTV